MTTDDPGPIEIADFVAQFADPLLGEFRDTWWRRWRFRNKPDHYRIARMEAELKLSPTTHPDEWEL